MFSKIIFDPQEFKKLSPVLKQFVIVNDNFITVIPEQK